MEFPTIGTQCAHDTCKMLDFLPIVCKCKKSFCSEHYHMHVLNCSECFDVVTPENTVKAHIYKCSQEDCKETSIVPLICASCKQHFCVAHRHIVCGGPGEEEKAKAVEKMRIPIQRFNEANEAVHKQIDANISEMKKKNKNAAMANKLQLMRIKNKATGIKTIPSSERVYFNVHNKNSGKVHPVFVSKIWTVGKTIDVLATELSLKNNNNQSNTLKLRLFKKETGNILLGLGDSVNELMKQEKVSDGEELIIAYVEDGVLNIN